MDVFARKAGVGLEGNCDRTREWLKKLGRQGIAEFQKTSPGCLTLEMEIDFGQAITGAKPVNEPIFVQKSISISRAPLEGLPPT